jgi:Trk-type K+ transport system membrane component
VTVTGLVVVDTAGQWSVFGEAVILALIQLGGIGIMTLASIVLLVLSRRVGLRHRLNAQVETGALTLGDVRRILKGVLVLSVVVEIAASAVLALRFWITYDAAAPTALWSGVFHGVSAFNNAGISLYSDSLTQFATDPFVVFPITLAFVIGGLGFPVLVEFGRRTRPRRWSLHTRITVIATVVLLVVGPVSILVLEWTNPATLGPLDVWDKIQAAWFQGVTPRTAGFNTIEIGSMREETLNIITGLMFIGAGPASTSGGIKVTTFAVLGYAMWAEVRGDQDVNVFNRRLPLGVTRQAMTVALLSVGVVFSTAIVLDAISPFTFTQTSFEAASAFGTVGLSTGITNSLPKT